MPARHENRSENRQRLMEIVEVVRRHEIIKGLTPEKLCAIIEELGPTFIKLGQILSMRSDILPKEYCEALKKLRSSVAPMPYEQVVSIVERSYGRPLGEVFSAFDEQALGSASIAQAHAAVLCSGESVVVKVQRDGIHDVMNRDILLLKRACKMLEYTPASGLVNFNQVLDEMWVVAQEEMNFLTEATNLALPRPQRGRGVRHLPDALPRMDHDARAGDGAHRRRRHRRPRGAAGGRLRPGGNRRKAGG